MVNKIVISISLIVLVVFAIYFYQEYQVKRIEINEIDLASINNGVYKGSYETMLVSATLQVKITEHQIVDIKIINHDNSRGEKAECIVNDVKDKQSLNVDVITGATASSKVILKAIETALWSGIK